MFRTTISTALRCDFKPPLVLQMLENERGDSLALPVVDASSQGNHILIAIVQASRSCANEATALPPVVSGMMFNSSIVTAERST